MPDPAQFVKRRTGPSVYLAARYLHGQTLDVVRQVALRGSHSAQLTEVPEWRLLLVRTGPPEDDPFYEVVTDGCWLVYDPETGNLAAWDDDEFQDAFGRAESDRLTAVTAAIGQNMALRPKQIATYALAAADAYRPVSGARTAVAVWQVEEIWPLIAGAIVAALGELDLTAEQRARALAAIPRHLRTPADPGEAGRG